MAYKKYCNARFSFCVSYPVTFGMGPSPDNNDGREFYDRDGFSMSASGMNNVLENSLRDEIKSQKKMFDTVTYRKIKNNWFVLSGYSGKNILYIKTYMVYDTIYHLYIRYPASLKNKYNKIVSTIAKSFKPISKNSSNKNFATTSPSIFPVLENTLTADIDSDGKKEAVQWEKFVTTQLGDYYQLKVFDDNGQILWKGPKKAEESNPYIFSSLHIGVSLPELLTDIDNDGYIELLAPELQSDVSPTYYRILRWKGSYFEPLPSYALTLRSETSNYFVWEKTNSIYKIWVSQLDTRNIHRPEFAKADVTAYMHDGTVKSGVALIKFVPKGAQIKRWIEPLLSDEERSRVKNNYTSTYRARLSYRDHRNSRGDILTKIIDILRQDRANIYKHHADSEDQTDPYFHTLDARSIMSQYQIIPIGRSYTSLEDLILNGTPLIEVTINSGQLYIKVLKRE
ncbi:MAG: hypothetical protein U9O64_08525 [Campylobacterota bacterium]|nr:hypothetical protein [Campylobacterota bacterium]